MFKAKDFKNVSLNAVAEKPTFKSVIIKGWPTAKETITVMATGIKNPIGKIIIACVIAIGDGLYNKFTTE